ncbi:MAG: choice-of-anchor B family protein, partial [Deltaproteobacteria bacterium]|nr:choice-of-anchor B family protein [Deltaproteobacteria bacterium]
DEVDEGTLGTPTTTRVIDITDLANPFQTAIFSNGNTARDHNLYTKGDLIFESNYRSGLRVFDASDPVAPAEIAYFDTYPTDNIAAYNGLWSVYPYFQSGTIIGSDLERGLFVWRLDQGSPVETPALSAWGAGIFLALLALPRLRRRGARRSGNEAR